MSSLKVEDFYDMKFLGNLNVANGRIFFEEFRPIEKVNKYESEIMELKGTSAVKYTRGREDRDSVIDQTGFRMAYAVKEEKKTTILVKDIESGRERTVWETEMTVKKMQWDSSSKGLYVMAQDKPKSEDFKIIEKYPIYFNGEGFFPGVGSKLVYVRPNGRVQTILEGEDEIVDFAVDPATRDIAVVVRPENWDVYDNRIGILSPGSREIRFMEDVKGGVSDPVYDRDGTLYFQFRKQKRSIFESSKIYAYRGRKLTNLLEKYDISPENSVNSDSRMGNSRTMLPHDGSIFFLATVGGRAGIYRVGIGEELKAIVCGDFSVDTFDFKGDVIYYIAQSSNLPQEIYEFDGKSRRITTINSRVERRELRKARNFKMKASDGMEIEGWFLKGRKDASILEIHGGPRTSYGEAFMFEFHLLNSLGFSVIYSNPRGSDSYGDNFALEIKGHYGERDYQDIMEIADFAINNFGVSREGMGVIGGSYGGFMVNWIVGHTDRFRAAVTDRSISDQISFYFSSDIGPRFNSDQIGGTPYEDLEHFWNKSPLKFATNVKTPLLIVHSEEDYRCPIWQAYELFTQLRKQGSEVRMISFKGENHDLSRGGKPKNRVKRLEEITGWFESKIIRSK